MKNNNQNNKGSALFALYFIIGLALLAVAGYYIGINEQQRLFKEIKDKKQAQEDSVLNGSSTGSTINETERVLIAKKDEQIKSLIDSPVVVLRNIAKNIDINSDESDGDVQKNKDLIKSIDDLYFGVAKNSKYFIKTSTNTKGEDVNLQNGEAVGDNCFSAPEGRTCLPKYTFEKIWAKGDLNNDSFDDIIISVLSSEKVESNDSVNRNYYVILFASSTKEILENIDWTSTTTSITKEAFASTSYEVLPFGYGLYSPNISSWEINNGLIQAIGNFYKTSDGVGNPSVSKIIKYKIATSTIVKSSEARLFKEQGDRVATWLLSSYAFNGLDFSLRTPETWQREEKYGETLAVTFKNPDGRDMFLNVKKSISTCSEYDLSLKDSKDLNLLNAEYIDLGEFGVGFYAKYSRKLDGGTNGYYADVCVVDKNNDHTILSLAASSKDDGDPYFVMFDKIWSTFKIRIAQ